jgi:adenylate kinase
LVSDFKYNHVSVGDLLREEVASQSDLGKEMDALMKEGKLVPVSVVLNVLGNALAKFKEGPGILIDGCVTRDSVGII